MCTIAILALLHILWIFYKARSNNGVAIVPSYMLLGWGGAAWSPTMMVISKSAYNIPALIEHERCHQKQQREIGTLKFFFKYFTDKSFRFDMELEAYRVYVRVSPKDIDHIVKIMINEYNFKKDPVQLKKLLLEDA